MFKYYSKKEEKTIKSFKKNGYIIFKLEDKKKLDKIKNFFVKEILKKNKNNLTKNCLNNFHNIIQPNNLNSFRMKLYSKFNKPDFKKLYFELAKNKLELICGNELVMQRKINLSIQMPNDDSSLLPIHSDVWSGCSPYEVVLWVPLVDVDKTKSMFILPKKTNDKYYKNFYKYKNSLKLQKSLDPKIKWLKINYGEGLIFSHALMHGNKINKTNETRWSFNCRFKSLMSPYDKKDLAETFMPISIRPITDLGINYVYPKIEK